jgi:hypothetical protein
MSDAESKAFKAQVIRHFEELEESYHRAQRFYLRDMNIDGKMERPNFGSDTILELFNLLGDVEITIEKFVQEYDRIQQAYISGMVIGTDLKGIPLPKPPAYAKARNYHIIFKKGDIITNPDFCMDDYIEMNRVHDFD